MTMPLWDDKILFLDCQTTGTHPKLGTVIEFGWSFASAREIQERGVDAIAVEGGLVAPPGVVVLPHVVREMTGISEGEFTGAPTVGEAWSHFRNQLEIFSGAGGLVPTAVHYARFEKLFLEAIHGAESPEIPFPLDFLCVQQLSKRLVPGLPALTIRAVSGYFGRVIGELHRTTPHVQATMEIWRNLVEQLPPEITDWSGLRDWMQAKTEKVKTKRVYQTPREKRLSVPNGPGVYRMISAKGKILYVGKATDLKSRVNSYFRTVKKNPRARMPELMSQVHDVVVTPTETCLEAALLENDEIKKWNPQYNAALKARSRKVFYCSPDFMRPSTEPGENRLGPFSSFYPFDELGAVAHFLQTGTDDYGAFPDLGDDATEVEILAEGRKRFLAEYPDAGSVASMVRLGRKMLRKLEEVAPVALVENDADEDIVEPEEEESEADVWTADEVYRSLGRKVVRAARLVKRARWICRVCEASLVWKTQRGWRWIEIEGAQIRDRGYLGDETFSPEQLEVPQSWKRSLTDRQKQLDVISFDRMSILLGEIRRLIKSGGPIFMKLTPDVRVDQEQLKKWLV